MTDLTHPHDGAWYACCLETLIDRVAPSALAGAIRERYPLPHLDPLASTSFPTCRKNISRPHGICPICNTGPKPLPYRFSEGKPHDPDAPHYCENCYKQQRHPRRRKLTHIGR